MFLGHIGLALGAKGVRTGSPLWVFIGASIAPDLIAGPLAMAGFSSDLYTHSIPAMIVYGFIAFVAYYSASKDWIGAAWVGGVAASHVIADFVTSRIMTFPGLPVWGFGLYHLPWVDCALESGIIVGGWWLYRKTIPWNRRNSPIAWLIVGSLVFLEVTVAALHLIR